MATPGFRLQPRDCGIVQAVWEHRALTTVQISQLLFGADAPTSRCLMRLRHLHQHGYLHRFEPPRVIPEGRKPYVYLLTKPGLQLLVDELGYDPEQIDWKPSDNDLGATYLDHLVATNDIRIALTLGANRQGGTIERWVDDKTLHSRHLKEYVLLDSPGGEAQKAAVVPDGYFLLHDGRWRYHHFIEADRGTVVGQSDVPGKRSFDRKVRVYLEYARSGLFQERYEGKGFRVLTVTTSQKRLEHLKRATEAVGGQNRFWFTTFDQVTPETVLTAPIWQAAGADKRYALLW